MGSAVCAPLLDIWDITPKPRAPDSLELSQFPKTLPQASQSASSEPSGPPVLDAEVPSEDVYLMFSSPEVGSRMLQLPA